MEIIQEIGSYAGLAAILGLAVLSALYFSQARDVRRLREWAGRAPERTSEPAAQPTRVVGRPVPKPPGAQPIQSGLRPLGQPAPGTPPSPRPRERRPPWWPPGPAAATPAAAKGGGRRGRGGAGFGGWRVAGHDGPPRLPRLSGRTVTITEPSPRTRSSTKTNWTTTTWTTTNRTTTNPTTTDHDDDHEDDYDDYDEETGDRPAVTPPLPAPPPRLVLCPPPPRTTALPPRAAPATRPVPARPWPRARARPRLRVPRSCRPTSAAARRGPLVSPPLLFRRAGPRW